ncbi:MAG: hypothetical protein R3A45_02075 [Bdellovibrionota bacterium]
MSFENGTFSPSYQMPVADWSVHINGAQDLQLAMPEDLSHGNSFELKQARQVSLKVGNIKSFRVEKTAMLWMCFTVITAKKVRASRLKNDRSFCKFFASTELGSADVLYFGASATA